MNSSKANHEALDDRLDGVGWGLLFLLVAALALPNGTTEYAAVSLVATTLILLNLVRMAVGSGIAWFGMVLGVSMLIAGIGGLLGTHMDVFAVFFGVAGAVMIGGALLHRTPAAATA